MKVWDAVKLDKEPLTFRGHTGVVRCLTFGFNGDRLASADLDDTILIWDSTQPADLRGRSPSSPRRPTPPTPIGKAAC